VDYVKFTVVEPLTYTIWTTSTYGFDVDTTLNLYDTNGTNELTYNMRFERKQKNRTFEMI